MDKADEIRRAEEEMLAALKKIADSKAGKMNTGTENIYGACYQRLVRLGARPQIRHKYRG